MLDILTESKNYLYLLIPEDTDLVDRVISRINNQTVNFGPPLESELGSENAAYLYISAILHTFAAMYIELDILDRRK